MANDDEEVLRKQRVIQAAVDTVMKEYADKGLLIEAGFRAMLHVSYPGLVPLPDRQFDELRAAYFAGAQHLFATMISMLDPGTEETEDDMRRMDLIHNELERFIDEYKTKYGLQPPTHPTPQ